MNDRIAALNAALAGRYRVERELGAGGMATVYLAHDARHDRRVAVKVLRPELSAILGAERFVAEIRTTANLQHPHILALFESGEAAGLVYYVMPFVDGESLRDRLSREKQLPVEEAIRIAREVADALQYAHERGVVHRDIKPENILLHGGHAVVADFGIALAASRSEGGSRMTETGMSLGTPQYMSPEQAMGEREITPRADIYALGCVLYEMLSGEPPFIGASAQAIVARVLTEEPRSLAQQRKSVPIHVDIAVRTALSKLPADRFATAREFSSALVTSGPAASGTSAMAAAPKSRPLAWLPWLVAGAAALVAAAGWLRSPRSEPDVARDRTLLRSRSLPPGLLPLGFAVSPDGQTLVFVDSIDGTTQLFVKRRDLLMPSPMPGTAGARRPVFSPAGDSIVFAVERRVKRMALSDGVPVLVTDDAHTTIPALAWLDDGTILYNKSDFGLWAMNRAGESRPVVQVTVLGRGVVHATPLPGGRGALITTCNPGCSESELRVVDLRTDSVRVLSEEAFQGWHMNDGTVVFSRRDGSVMKAQFDLNSLTFVAHPVPVLDGIRTSLFSADLVLSTGGTLFYVEGEAVGSGGNAEAVWITKAGVTSVVDSTWRAVSTHQGAGLALSPDGNRVAVMHRSETGEDIWIKDLRSGAFNRLTFEGYNRRPVWSLDGRSIIYMSEGRPGQANEDVFRRNADGTGSEQVLYDEDRPVVEVQPTRDTTQFVVRVNTPSRDIYLLRRLGDSTTLTPLLAESYSESQPVLSPDGRWLAYTSNETGSSEVYVRPFPDVNSGRWQISREGGNEPLWSRSGRELYYRGRNRFMAAQVSTTGTFAVGEQRSLFPTLGLFGTTTTLTSAISPDDSRFLFLRAVQGVGTPTGATELIRVENWLAEVNSKTRR